MDIIGVDLGGTKCAVSLFIDGRPHKLEIVETTDPDATLERLMSAIERSGRPVSPVFGISAGDPQDSQRGMLLGPPNMPGWDEVPVVGRFIERFGGEGFLMNDANAGALAEWAFGAGRGARSVVFLTAGTGMGAGLILDGRLYEGASGGAGEVGHVRLAEDGPVGYGKAGSFEGFTSGGGIARQAREFARERGGSVGFNPGEIESITTRDVVEAAARGDRDALDLLESVGRRLGQGLAILVDILDPEVIVIGSLYVRARRFIERAMREALEEEALPRLLRPLCIVPAQLGEEIGDYAAASVALYRKGLML